MMAASVGPSRTSSPPPSSPQSLHATARPAVSQIRASLLGMVSPCHRAVFEAKTRVAKVAGMFFALIMFGV
jgi:hypothetical protein